MPALSIAPEAVDIKLEGKNFKKESNFLRKLTLDHSVTDVVLFVHETFNSCGNERVRYFLAVALLRSLLHRVYLLRAAAHLNIV